MTTSTPVERVATFLSDQGYTRLPTPLVIGGIRFDFPAVFSGGDGSSELVLVVDTVIEDNAKIVRNVLGVARALDVARFKNPLATVIIGPKPTPDQVSDMAGVCRVLPAGTISGQWPDDRVKNWLAVLMPLELELYETEDAHPMQPLFDSLDETDTMALELVRAAAHGIGEVEEIINSELRDILEKAWEELE